MKKINITIGSKSYKVELAQTEDELVKGLSSRNSLANDEGMLFMIDEDDSEEVSFWMKDTKIPLDIIFIDEELNVISVKEGIPDSEEFITENNVTFVLEVNKNSGIVPGDKVEFYPESKVKKEKMLVLDSNGKVQMELEGGERIVSRPETKVLIRKAKKALVTTKDSDFRTLGKYIFKVLEGQDSRSPEYVEGK